MSWKNPVKIRASVERTKGAISFLISAVNHSPKGRQKADTGVGVRARAATGVGIRWCCQRLGRVGGRAALKSGVGGLALTDIEFCNRDYTHCVNPSALVPTQFARALLVQIVSPEQSGVWRSDDYLPSPNRGITSTWRTPSGKILPFLLLTDPK